MSDILVVEDDTNLTAGIRYALECEGFYVDIAENMNNARGFLRDRKYDLILLDVMLPDGDGYELCGEIRRNSEVPIIYLTACDEEANIVMGLDMGGDDYITKPFRIRELLSRIRAVLRRKPAASPLFLDGKIIAGDLVVNVREGKVFRKNTEITLTSMEYRLLLIFINHPRQVLPRGKILEKMWDANGEFVDDNTLSVYIRRLREKIEENPYSPVYIKTLRGIGYRWDVETRRGI